MNEQNKLTIKTKEGAKQLNELTNELVAASLFDSNLFWILKTELIFNHMYFYIIELPPLYHLIDYSLLNNNGFFFWSF